MKRQPLLLVILSTVLLIVGSSGNNISTAAVPSIVVNSLEDLEDPPAGMVTLRSALAIANHGQSITFDPSLDGGTIELSIVGEQHTVLKGEVMGMREEPSGPVSYLVGYFERDYGKSALYARKDVLIDASALPSGITLAWVGGEEDPARVLAVYGNLTITNVSITGGCSVAEELPPPDPEDEHGQLSTRARGGGLAVWGIARLVNCTLYDNHCLRGIRVPARSRDAGVFGGGVYADIVNMKNCVVSGNSISASGVSGGGVFSVGGAEARRWTSSLEQTAITGNRISGIFAYGGGCYSDGGGIGKSKTLALENCTIARNLVEPLPGLPPFMYGIGYWRGGGVYMSNGYMRIHGCTIVENQVHGVPRTGDLGKPNLAGGVAATIGNAHAVERMTIAHSLITGNTVHEVGGIVYDQDIFTGSLLYFRSVGYNRIGAIDFSQILVPVGEPDWASLCRKHYPKEGDEDGVDVADVLNLSSGITYSDSILSAGVDAPNPVVLHYDPRGSALDQIPTSPYTVNEVFAEYEVEAGGNDTFLAIVLARVESHFGLTSFAGDFTTDFEAFLQTLDSDDETPGVQPYTDPSGNPILTLADTQWFGPAETWPKQLPNYPYIHFWHRLDSALFAENIPGMGSEVLGDDDWWALFSSGPLAENPAITMSVWERSTPDYALLEVDQLGTERPVNSLGDIGACEHVMAVPTLNIRNISTDLSGLSVVGQPVQINVSAIGQGSPLYYKFLLRSEYETHAPGNWRLLQDWSTNDTIQWTPAAESTCMLVAYATHDTSGGGYHQAGLTIETGSNPITITAFTSDMEYPQPSGAAIALNATAFGGRTPFLYYKYLYARGTRGQPTEIRGYEANSHCSWTPPEKGIYTVVVQVTDDLSSSEYSTAGMTCAIGE